METNIGIRTYRQIETLADEISKRKTPKQPASTGLLAPKSMSRTEEDVAEQQSAYRVASAFNTIRRMRMENQSG
jgi:hypothetical protein|tara:strand:+ start:1819 stop:2040 length:222 start_codon:yes stop_codon:yes gene_type:complete